MPADTTRLFVGLDIPGDIRARLKAYVYSLKARGAEAKWTNPDGWHITLKFIGWTKREPEIREALKAVSASPFNISFRGLGFFAPKQPRVFYVDVHAPPALAELAAQVDRTVVPFGVEAESRPYSPHLTLARSGSGNPHGAKGESKRASMTQLKHIVESMPESPQIEFGTMTANEFILYLSELSPKGAKYTALEKYPLKA
jgi:2'-5' RNA ligase